MDTERKGFTLRITPYAHRSSSYAHETKSRDKRSLAMINEETKTIHIIWSVEDVLECAENEEVTLSEKEAWEILKRVYHHHDCNNGITWHGILDELDMYLREVRGEQ
jgi:hypothetical protein